MLVRGSGGCSPSATATFAAAWRRACSAEVPDVQRAALYVQHLYAADEGWQRPCFQDLGSRGSKGSSALSAAAGAGAGAAMSAGTFSVLAEGDPEDEYVDEVSSGWYMAASLQLQSCA